MDLHACVVSAGWMDGWSPLDGTTRLCVYWMDGWSPLDGWVESTGWNYTPVWCLLDGWMEST